MPVNNDIVLQKHRETAKKLNGSGVDGWSFSLEDLNVVKYVDEYWSKEENKIQAYKLGIVACDCVIEVGSAVAIAAGIVAVGAAVVAAAPVMAAAAAATSAAVGAITAGEAMVIGVSSLIVADKQLRLKKRAFSAISEKYNGVIKDSSEKFNAIFETGE